MLAIQLTVALTMEMEQTKDTRFLAVKKQYFRGIHLLFTCLLTVKTLGDIHLPIFYIKGELVRNIWNI